MKTEAEHKFLKKTIKRLLFIIVFFVISIANQNGSVFADEKENAQILVIKNEDNKENLEEITYILENTCCEEEYSKYLSIGEYFSVYNADIDSIVYIYPIFSKDKCILLAYVDGDNITISEDTEMYYNICKIRDKDYLIVVRDGNYYAETENANIKLGKLVYKGSCSRKGLNRYNFEDLVDRIERLAKLNIEFEKIPQYNDVLRFVDLSSTSYSSSMISTNSIFGNDAFQTYKCNIKNFVMQGKYNLCWAATVATIVNYKKSTNLTAKNVADTMNISYNSGATIFQTYMAFHRYGILYGINMGKLSWLKVKQSISKDKPFAIFLLDGNIGHVITGYGYAYKPSDSIGISYIVHAWDSNGNKILFMYNADTINIGTYRFKWKYTIS